MLPSTSPSRYKSSLPESSPRINTDLPMRATSFLKLSAAFRFSIGRDSFLISGFTAGVMGRAGAEGAGCSSGLEDFHIHFSLLQVLTEFGSYASHRQTSHKGNSQNSLRGLYRMVT